MKSNYNPQKIGGIDHRDIESLHPVVQELAKKFLIKANEFTKQYNVTVKIVSTLRTWAEQDEIYAQGRTKRGDIVTNVKGGGSKHNWGVAFDIGLFDSKNRYNTKEIDYLFDKLAPIGKGLGMEWGGDWVKPKDRPHYQYTGKLSNSEFMKQVTLYNLDNILGYTQYNTMEELLKNLGLME